LTSLAFGSLRARFARLRAGREGGFATGRAQPTPTISR
jgi:hypothetical protein